MPAAKVLEPAASRPPVGDQQQAQPQPRPGAEPDGGVAPRRLGGRDGGMGWGRTVAVVAWFTGSYCRRRSVGFTTCLTRLLGMANPTPMLPEDCWLTVALAVVIPTTWPAAFTSAPPESPGLTEASV